MKKTITVFAVTLILSALSACSTTIKLTQLRFESPEVTGQGQHQAVIRFNSPQSIDVHIKGTGDFANPVITTEQMGKPPSFPDNVTATNIPVENLYYWTRDTLSYLLSTADLASYAGVNDSLDIYINTEYGMPMLRAKYQLFGDPASRATAGNFSMSLDGGYGYDALDGLKGLDANALDLALITGYRLSDKLMIYGGPYRTRYDIKDAHGSARSNVNSDGVNTGIRYNFDSRHAIYLEKSTSTVTSGASVRHGTYYGLSMEFRN